MELQITMPYPPSVNRYWRHSRGRHFISKDGSAYSRRVQAMVIDGGIKMIRDPVRIEIVAFPPDKRTRDLDNLLKATLDALERSKILENDSQVKEIAMSWGDVVKGGKMQLRILVL